MVTNQGGRGSNGPINGIRTKQIWVSILVQPLGTGILGHIILSMNFGFYILNIKEILMYNKTIDMFLFRWLICILYN